jgi:Glycosyltransferase family 87
VSNPATPFFVLDSLIVLILPIHPADKWEDIKPGIDTMPLAAPPAPARDAFCRFVIAVWAVLLLVVSARCAIWPRHHSLYEVYLLAGENWVHSQSLYYRTDIDYITEYRYSPSTALFFVPLYFLPEWLAGVVGRLVSAAVFLTAFGWWLTRGVPHTLWQRHKAGIFLLSVPIVMGSLNNGQLNVIVIGFLLAAVTATSESRWWLAGMCIGLATGMKLYPLALGLLLWVLYPRKLTLPIGLSLLGLGLLPFLCQRPSYVLDQYSQWYTVLVRDNRRFLDPTLMYRDLWLLLHDLRVPMMVAVYQVIQVASGAACALLCLLAQRRGWSPAALATLVLVLGSCWMLLCGPATEASTYAMLGPALVYLTIAAGLELWPRTLRYLPATAYALMLAWTFTGVLSPGARNFTRSVAPLAALILASAYVLAVVGMLWRAKHARGDETSSLRPAA